MTATTTPTTTFPAPALDVDPTHAMSRVRRWWRGDLADPPWYRPSVLALVVLAAIGGLWALGASGWANAYYSAAAQAGSQSWKAWFFGSFDSAGSITVDKPPAALWVMGLSVRLFGLSSWSILVPEALMGVGTVALLTATVKRWFRPGAALLAGAVLALTPVAALMFRFNNPDALLVLLLTGAAYATTRALEKADTRWLVLAGTLVGFGFLTKMLQAFVVLPVFGLVVLVAAPTSLARRVRQVIVLGVAALVASGWWVAIVELWPASSRPYIGGSQDNSVLDLIFGYNGLGRVTGNETGSVGGGAAGTSGRWGPTGWLRMFNSQFGGQISWLIPSALLLLVAGLIWTLRRPRTDRTRAALGLWGGWLLLTGVVFSLSQGIIHEYYSVALAPAIGALVGIGASMVWDRREQVAGRLVGAAAVGVAAGWSVVLLDRTPDWNPWLRPTVAVTGALAAVLIAVGAHRRRLAIAAVALASIAGLGGSAAYAVQTVSTTHSGSIPTAGPRVAGSFGPGGMGGPGTTGGGPGGMGGGPGAMGGGPGAVGSLPQGVTLPAGFSPPAGLAPGAGGGGRMGGGVGGLLDATTPSDEVVSALTVDADQYTWVVATVGANSAAGYQLATGEAVMAIGGFNGTDPSPTLAEFQADVAAGEIHYFVPGGGMGGPGGGSSPGTASEITTWVEQSFAQVNVGGTTMYDLTQPVG